MKQQLSYNPFGFYFNSKQLQGLAETVRSTLLTRLWKGSPSALITSYLRSKDIFNHPGVFVRDSGDTIFCRCFEITADGEDRVQYDVTFLMEKRSHLTPPEYGMQDILVEITIARGFREIPAGRAVRHVLGMDDDVVIAPQSICEHLSRLIPIGASEEIVQLCVNFLRSIADDMFCYVAYEEDVAQICLIDRGNDDLYKITLYHRSDCLYCKPEKLIGMRYKRCNTLIEAKQILRRASNSLYSTAPVDRERTVNAVNAFYWEFWHRKPPTIIWCESPFQMLLAPAITSKLAEGFDIQSLRSELAEAFRQAFDHQIAVKIESSFWRLMEDISDSEVPNSNLELRFMRSEGTLMPEAEALELMFALQGDLYRELRQAEERAISKTTRESLRHDYLRLNAPAMEELSEALESIGHQFVHIGTQFFPNSTTINLGWDSGFLMYHRCLEAFHDKPMYSNKIRDNRDIWLNLLSSAFAFRFVGDICFACDNPLAVHLDRRFEFHNRRGSALRFRDGYELYALHGVVIPRYVIEEPNRITVQDIEREPNAEVRRIKLERYGESRFIQDSNAKLLDESAVGKLFRKQMPHDEPLVMVQVVNSTPEPDGTYRKYFLRVPPSTQTAAEAVAWTFGMEEQEYRPIVET